MTAPLQLYLIRHGETAWSLTGQHTGHTDLPLTPHGEAMARGLTQSLRGLVFAQVLTSPRLRARTTCALAGLGDAARTEPDLAEWDYGDYEGLRTAQIRQRHPDWDVWEHGCPGGEAPAEVGVRADRLIERLSERGGRVALFSHGQFGRVLAARWIGLGVAEGRHFCIDPASTGILGTDASHAGRRVVVRWNVVAVEAVPLTLAAAVIRSDIEAALTRSALSDAGKIVIEVHGNDVSLSGSVKHDAERATVTQAAWASPGVHNVVDMMTLAH